jgi:aminopeptidase YwaD
MLIRRLAFVLVCLSTVAVAFAQPGPPPPKTPLKQDVLSLLANEVSGQMAFNNEVLLAGAPRLREAAEFSGTMFEAQKIFDLVRGYGIENTRIERSASPRTFDYPVEGELWITEPERRLVARLGADAALVGNGSSTADLTGELIYVPPLSADEAKKMLAAGVQDKYRGKLALMWSHAREETAKALDAAGVAGVISFSSRERYFDPNQVVHGGGSYKNANLKVGLNVSWRQWSELLEDVLSGRKVVVRAKTKIETYKDKFEAVYSWIPGTEPDAKGVIFTAHLFEGYIKRGANDDMSGCVVQLEILRALNRLIASGQLPKPRRTIYFLWPTEISGTYEFIKQHPGIADRWSININMDMVGEWLRRNNAVMTMSECPDHLPCYLDGLATSVMNYVWRTNDIVYLPDAPRGRAGGQYFPQPMMEKNGSDDAFRFFVHRATGGSDHICFNNPSVGVPGIELFTWPDQWYHADTDTPDKSDPTQMKRIAFVGAASAWAAANCTDEVLGGLLDAVSDFGYRRVAERDLPKALALLDAANAGSLAAAVTRALNLVDFAVDREAGALRSIEDVYSASAVAKAAVGERVRQWELYRAALKGQVDGYGKVRAGSLGVPPTPPGAKAKERRSPAAVALAVTPALAPAIKGREFSLAAYEPYAAHLKANPDALKKLALTPSLGNSILNYVNGRRTVAAIRNAVVAETGQDVTLETVTAYFEMLKSVGWVSY